jgi:MYXO-CTERM domain-containing protein
VGGSADIWIKVAQTPSGQSIILGPFTVTLGGGTMVPPNLALGTRPFILGVPEPSSLTMGALGLAALLMIRRRRYCIPIFFFRSGRSTPGRKLLHFHRDYRTRMPLHEQKDCTGKK